MGKQRATAAAQQILLAATAPLLAVAANSPAAAAETLLFLGHCFCTSSHIISRWHRYDTVLK